MLSQEQVNVALGKQIKAEREENHLTQAALAERMGVTRSWIANMESGKQR